MRWPLWSKTPPPTPSPDANANADADADEFSAWHASFGFDLAPPILAVALTLTTLHLYKARFRRIPTTLHLPPTSYRTRTLFGRVTSVGDGDNFRLFHTPGGRALGWHWLRALPTTRKELTGQTIHVRLAGVDAPERAHFGKPAQPGGEEAMRWLQQRLLGRSVRVRLWRKDHFDRAVATVHVIDWGGLWRRSRSRRRDVGLEMVREGWASVYQGGRDGEWGGEREKYEAAQEAAKRERRGMWSGGGRRRVVLPGEFKKGAVGARVGTAVGGGKFVVRPLPSKTTTPGKVPATRPVRRSKTMPVEGQEK